jgi:hypothetical protein
MTEQEAVNAIQRAPTQVQMIVCGSDTGHPFQCKIVTYIRRYPGSSTLPTERLDIVLEQSPDGSWRVSSWTVM